MHSVAGIGVGGVFGRALTARIAPENRRITADDIKAAEWVAGITLSDDERADLARRLNRQRSGVRAARRVEIPYTVPPAVRFDPTPFAPQESPLAVKPPYAPVKAANKLDGSDLDFADLTALAGQLAAGHWTSLALTERVLARLKAGDEVLKCVVTLTPELARRQALASDARRAAGQVLGPLDGVPWGAKDLISHPAAPTTWGAGYSKNQQLNETATVAKKLEAAGCVMVAKLTLGALALGDKWFGGMTRNPWNPKEGSSGSSAGSASAVAAGLVPFAIGSETLGSIVSPATRCGATGLRPTYGRVSRAGCMTLSWSMDKLGPLCRSARDCALVLDAIHGADPADPASVTRPFPWPCSRPVNGLRVGYTPTNTPVAKRPELRTLEKLSVELVPISLPGGDKVAAMDCILDAECAAAFDDITRAGVSEGIGPWGGTFRAGRFTTAIDYLRANRCRSMVMAEMAEVMSLVDLYVGGNDLFLTNMTGHPTVCLPNGFTRRGGAEVPTALTFTGRLYGEAELLAVAATYQDATGFHLRRPPMA